MKTRAGPWLRHQSALWCGLIALIMTLAPAAAQTLGQGADDGISIWRVVLALLVCLGLAAAVPFVLKIRMGGTLPFRFATQRNRRLQLIESLRIGHQTDLCVVSMDGRLLLLAVSAKGVDLLERLTVEDGKKSPGEPK
jgi:flagellar biogenesis protein FliO